LGQFSPSGRLPLFLSCSPLCLPHVQPISSTHCGPPSPVRGPTTVTQLPCFKRVRHRASTHHPPAAFVPAPLTAPSPSAPRKSRAAPGLHPQRRFPSLAWQQLSKEGVPQIITNVDSFLKPKMDHHCFPVLLEIMIGLLLHTRPCLRPYK
jgi:hypothetical protein